MINKVQALIQILFDKTAREDERDDAAVDLRKYPCHEALNALIEIISDPKEDFVIVDSAIESYAEICAKLNYFDQNLLKKKAPFACNAISEIILARNPSIIKKI